MKRIGILMSFLLLLVAPAIATIPSSPILTETTMLTELPWSTIQAVFKKVAEQGHYTFDQLVNWYDQGLLTVEKSGSSYVVTIYDATGLLDVILTDHI